MKFNERTFNIISLIGVVAMFAIVVVDFLVPKPYTTLTRRVQAENIRQLNDNVKVYQAQLKTATTSVDKYVWKKNSDEISSQSLKNVTAIAIKHKVQMLGFRPQKPSEDGGFTHLPYLVLLSGTYPNVQAALQDIEAPVNRLAISLVQFASADANSDSVNATIGVVAYSLTPGGANATTTAAK
ncbi:MAG TPA: type 4a pilus biogenesis protein PilO [Fimbriimonadaceae bacterium]|jgi:Tfp pilus assembly protein PilO